MEQQFDRQEMARLIKLAMGGKTPFEYSRLAKLDGGYIDRLMTMQVKKPPTLNIIRQIAASSQGLVALNELKAAAGYEQDEEELRPETGRIAREPEKSQDDFQTEISGCIKTIQEAAEIAENRQTYLERLDSPCREDLLTIPKENIHIPEEFLKADPKTAKTVAAAEGNRTSESETANMPEPAAKKMTKKERRRQAKMQAEQASAMETAAMAMAQSDPVPVMNTAENVTTNETIRNSAESVPRKSDGSIHGRDARELAMYRSMGKRHCYRVYGDEPEADVFRFRDEHGMVAVYDFTLENKETYGFNDLCALYGRMKALRPDEGTTYLVCVNKKAGDILTDSMERNFGTCKNFRTFEEEETAWA